MSLNDETNSTYPAPLSAGGMPVASGHNTTSDTVAAESITRNPDSLTAVTPTGQDANEPCSDRVPLDELAMMAGALERFHGRAEQYEDIIRRMQSRIEQLQADQVRELLKPVILRLADLHTEASAAEVRASTREDDSARKDFDYFLSEIEETLGLLDIESINVSALDEFDAARHAARRRIDTDDPSLDRRIAKVVRQGFTYVGAERVFVPAVVNVYRHKPASQGNFAPPIGNPESAN